ncbi:2-iminoacetate synthase ThiH [Candidatus Methylacidithermus pantelleriae]|uniref:2-iminoacetate synthase ThiH n=1 Tax=Candidatus Methylacidithermus pantelleriae TaxID=2744239 RepID=UPI00157DF4A2|nr:2-iminoacetate synthase ThiH [Candidatus Methylacidithermus pantelleriae]
MQKEAASFDSLYPLEKASPRLARLKAYLEPMPREKLRRLAIAAQELTVRHFGRTMRLFAPLYLSNECVNICQYCGFSRTNRLERITLSPEEVEKEARYLTKQGFRHLLLVSGEHPKKVSVEYLIECVERLRPFVPEISLEVAPLDTCDYARLVQAGLDGMVIYQETYDPESYACWHVAGPKRDFLYRLLAPVRAYEAGIRRIGIGALFGLTPWQEEALRLGRHLDALLRQCWKAFLTVSFPRIRPSAGNFVAPFPLADRDLIQLVIAFRLSFPQVGLVLSTRETPALRDALAPVGITMMSAGSRTDPGGYTGAGLRTVPIRPAPTAPAKRETREQFAIADDRSPEEVAARLQELGYDPVWKDWERCTS